MFLLRSLRKGVPGLFKLVLGSKEADNTPKESIIVHPPTSEGVTAANSEDKNIHWVLVNNEFHEVFSSVGCTHFTHRRQYQKVDLVTCMY